MKIICGRQSNVGSGAPGPAGDPHPANRRRYYLLRIAALAFDQSVENPPLVRSHLVLRRRSKTVRCCLSRHVASSRGFRRATATIRCHFLVHSQWLRALRTLGFAVATVGRYSGFPGQSKRTTVKAGPKLVATGVLSSEETGHQLQFIESEIMMREIPDIFSSNYRASHNGLLTLAKWETVSGQFGGYLKVPFSFRIGKS
jgi:hypothetical protein